jgi:hypothetical protein
VKVEAPVTFNAPDCEIEPGAGMAVRLPPTVEEPSFRSFMFRMVTALPPELLSLTAAREIVARVAQVYGAGACVDGHRAGAGRLRDRARLRDVVAGQGQRAAA